MTAANRARHDGDKFQARMFWLLAANLLKINSPISKVSWETGPKGMDDIQVEYRDSKRSRNGPICREYIQCKWHVRAGEFGFADLADPKFVNGATHSWLSRAYYAFLVSNSAGAQYILQTNWRINAKDPLFKLHRSENGLLDVALLFNSSTDNSEMGQVRKCWREHLGITEEELRNFISTIRIVDNVGSMDDLRDRLDDRLVAVGLRSIPTSQSAFIYDDLIYKLHGEGEVVLDEKSLRKICDREGLWATHRFPQPTPFTLGIRSFLHAYDDMQDRCDSLCDLVPYFRGRYLDAGKGWSTDILPKLQEFIKENAQLHQQLRLRIDAHSSIAFAAGRLLNVKSGVATEIEQRTLLTGIQLWSADEYLGETPVSVEVSDRSGVDIAVALSITHDVLSEVKIYCKHNLPLDYRLLDVRLSSGPSGLGVKNGGHAWRIAEYVATLIRQQRNSHRLRIHLFAAAPNALLFFLGQQLGLGEIVIYEYDFEKSHGGGYKKSIVLEE